MQSAAIRSALRVGLPSMMWMLRSDRIAVSPSSPGRDDRERLLGARHVATEESGRDEELGEVVSLVDAPRLDGPRLVRLTVVGPVPASVIAAI